MVLPIRDKAVVVGIEPAMNKSWFVLFLKLARVSVRLELLDMQGGVTIPDCEAKSL